MRILGFISAITYVISPITTSDYYVQLFHKLTNSRFVNLDALECKCATYGIEIFATQQAVATITLSWFAQGMGAWHAGLPLA